MQNNHSRGGLFENREAALVSLVASRICQESDSYVFSRISVGTFPRQSIQIVIIHTI